MAIQELDEFTVDAQAAGERLDKLLSLHYPEQSRSYFQDLIDKERVRVNGQPAKKRVKPQEGDRIEVRFLLTPEIRLDPADIPLDILYEDEWVIAVNKPVGMVVHPAPGNWTGTLVNALLGYLKSRPEGGEGLRPGIVHRLDKDTSGVLIAAKTAAAHQKLVELFAERKVKKTYLTVCAGKVPQMRVDEPIARHRYRRKEMRVVEEGGRAAVTDFVPLGHNERLCVVKALPTTGRTHQIRVHLKHLNRPVLGDSLYGNARVNKQYGVEHHLLHAWKLELPHPITGENLELEAEVPEVMQKFCREICGEEVR